MGGGSKKAPEPTKFTPPPLQDGPANNPIANFFAPQASGQPRQNPFAAIAQIAQPQAQNPFGAGQSQMTPEMIDALLRKIRGQG